MPDLDSIKREVREAAAKRIIERRGHEVAQIFSLSSGLGLTVELTDGRTVTIGSCEIAAEAPDWWKQS